MRPNLNYPYTASNGITYQPHPNGWTVNLQKMRRFDAEDRLHKGIDGWFNYLAAEGRLEAGVISVKVGGRVNPNMVRDLARVMQRDKHRFGLFIMKSLPTRGMREEVSSNLIVETEFGRFPALQIVMLADLMRGVRPTLPPLLSPVKRASRVEMRASRQQDAQGSLI